MTRKILAVILALAMIFALGLTACGGEKTAEDGTKASGTTKASDKKEETTAATKPDGEAVQVDWYNCGDYSDTPDWEEYVWPWMEEYVRENCNIELVFHGIAGGDYSTKFTAAITSGADIDLFEMGVTANTGFYVWYERNALAGLNGYLDEYCPQLVEHMPDYAFKACTIEGEIYAIPTIKDLATDIGYMYNEDLLKKLGLLDELLAIDYENAKDYDEFFYHFQEVRNEQIPEDADIPCHKVDVTLWTYFKADMFTTGVYTSIPDLGCFEDHPSNEVFNLYESDEYLDYISMVYRWVQDNINPYDSANFDSENIYRKEGHYPGMFEWGLMTAEYDAFAEYGWHEVLIHPQYAFTYTLQMHDAKYGFSALTTEEKRVGAVQFYNALSEDENLSTAWRFGVEDIHWKRTTDSLGNTRSTFDFEGGRNSDPTARNFFKWYNAGMGDMYTIIIPVTEDDHFLDILTNLNETAKASDNMGFLLSTTNIANEIAAVANVVGEYHNDLRYGMIDNYEERIDEFNTALYANGMQAIIDDAQAQLDEYRG